MDKQRLERLMLLGTVVAVWLGLPTALIGFSEHIPYASKTYVISEIQPVKELLVSKLVSDNKNEINRLEDMQDALKIQLTEKKDLSTAERVNIERRIKRSEQTRDALELQNRNLIRCGRTVCGSGGGPF